MLIIIERFDCITPTVISLLYMYSTAYLVSVT